MDLKNHPLHNEVFQVIWNIPLDNWNFDYTNQSFSVKCKELYSVSLVRNFYGDYEIYIIAFHNLKYKIPHMFEFEKLYDRLNEHYHKNKFKTEWQDPEQFIQIYNHFTEK